MGLVDEIITRYVLDDSQYNKAQRRMIDGAQSMERRIDLVGKSLLGAGAAGTAFSLSSLRQAGAMQRQIVSLEALTGSAEGARRAFKFFDDRAGKSYFNLTELVEAGKLMTAFGLNTQKYLPLAEDLAAGFGVSLEETTRALGRLRAGDYGEAFERAAAVSCSRPRRGADARPLARRFGTQAARPGFRRVTRLRAGFSILCDEPAYHSIPGKTSRR